MKPNILFIMADQFRYDSLGVVNGWVKTPNLDRLCTRGFLFQNTICNSVECIPSRISLATGLYPHQTGVWTNINCTLNPSFPNWMQTVEAAGYSTSLFGKTHLHPHEGDLRDRLHLMHGYGLQVVDETTGPRASMSVLSNMTQAWQENDLWESYQRDFSERFATRPHLVRPSSLPIEHYYDVYVGRAACRHLENLPRDKSWFCWVSFGGPHEPWDAPEPYASMYSASDIPPPIPRMPAAPSVRGLLAKAFASNQNSPANLTVEEIARMKANYAGCVSLIDAQIGDILNAVEARGERDNTLIVFTSDHGEMNGDQGLIYKSNFLDQALKVPLIIVPPVSTGRDKKRHGIIKSLVELMDVGATMSDYADGEQSHFSQARTLRPLLEHEASAHRDFAVSEFGGYSIILTEQWKAEFDHEMEPTLLIDRQEDATEQFDLSNRSIAMPILAKLKEVLRDFRSSTPSQSNVVTK
jgi:arylsulfatase